ncbi:MAG: NAD(P)/FAD-dependent oxidoreductase [Gemmatimonadaceae bacterium]|nr:NAD(P)/FAD-dependent oxidoreductase [Gemmatimonadaceae bacterium]
MNRVRTQVLVVGGGPAGTSAAWHCAQLGLDVLLLDRAQFPRRKACAEYVSPGAARILESMGVLSAITQQAPTLRGMTVHAPNGVRIQGRFGSAPNKEGSAEIGFGVRRELLDALLLDRARATGVEVREGVTVDQILMDNGVVVGVTTRSTAQDRMTDAPQEIRADIVIGADGLRSVVARRLKLAHTARWPRRYAFVAHYRHVANMGDVGEMHVLGDTRAQKRAQKRAQSGAHARTHAGYVGLARVSDDVTNVALVVPAHHARTAAGRPQAFLDEWLAAHPELSPRMQYATRVSDVQTTGPFASHARRPWAPGALLTGDAADFFDPFTGEGIQSALIGGELLAPHALHAIRSTSRSSHAEALRQYAQTRRQAFAGKWRIEHLIGVAVAFPALLNYAARVLSRDPHLADLLVGATGGVIPPSAVLRPATLWRFLTS